MGKLRPRRWFDLLTVTPKSSAGARIQTQAVGLQSLSFSSLPSAASLCDAERGLEQEGQETKPWTAPQTGPGAWQEAKRNGNEFLVMRVERPSACVGQGLCERGCLCRAALFSKVRRILTRRVIFKIIHAISLFSFKAIKYRMRLCILNNII